MSTANEDELTTNDDDPPLLRLRRCIDEINQVEVSASAMDKALQEFSKNGFEKGRQRGQQWTDLLNGLAEDKDDMRASLVLRWMEANKIPLHAEHYGAVALACDRADNWDEVHALMAEAHHKKIGSLPGVIRLCRKELEASEATMIRVDAVLRRYTQLRPLEPPQWLGIIQGLGQGKDSVRALLVLRWMETNQLTDASHFGAAAGIFREVGDLDKAHALVEEVLVKYKGADSHSSFPNLREWCRMELISCTVEEVGVVLQKYDAQLINPKYLGYILRSVAQESEEHGVEKAGEALQWIEQHCEGGGTIKDYVFVWEGKESAHGPGPVELTPRKGDKRWNWEKIHMLIERMITRGGTQGTFLLGFCLRELEQNEPTAEAVADILTKYDSYVLHYTPLSLLGKNREVVYKGLGHHEWEKLMSLVKDLERRSLVLDWLKQQSCAPQAASAAAWEYAKKGDWHTVHELIEGVYAEDQDATRGVAGFPSLHRFFRRELGMVKPVREELEPVLERYTAYEPALFQGQVKGSAATLSVYVWTGILTVVFGRDTRTESVSNPDLRTFLILKWMEANAVPTAVGDETVEVAAVRTNMWKYFPEYSGSTTRDAARVLAEAGEWDKLHELLEATWIAAGSGPGPIMEDGRRAWRDHGPTRQVSNRWRPQDFKFPIIMELCAQELRAVEAAFAQASTTSEGGGVGGEGTEYTGEEGSGEEKTELAKTPSTPGWSAGLRAFEDAKQYGFRTNWEQRSLNARFTRKDGSRDARVHAVLQRYVKYGMMDWRKTLCADLLSELSKSADDKTLAVLVLRWMEDHAVDPAVIEDAMLVYFPFYVPIRQIHRNTSQDWLCNSCQNINYFYRPVCNVCGLDKEVAMAMENALEKENEEDPAWRGLTKAEIPGLTDKEQSDPWYEPASSNKERDPWGKDKEDWEKWEDDRPQA
jgi:hypothetical protein